MTAVLEVSGLKTHFFTDEGVVKVVRIEAAASPSFRSCSLLQELQPMIWLLRVFGFFPGTLHEDEEDATTSLQRRNQQTAGSSRAKRVQRQLQAAAARLVPRAAHGRAAAGGHGRDGAAGGRPGQLGGGRLTGRRSEQ